MSRADEALALLESLESRGVKVWAEAQQLMVYPKALLNDDLRARIAEYKPELLAMVARPPESDPVLARLLDEGKPADQGRSFGVSHASWDSEKRQWCRSGSKYIPLGKPREK